MSLLAFLGLRQPKRLNRTPLTLADVLHRTFVSGLAALTVYGIYLGFNVHEHILAKGREALALRETETKVQEAEQAVQEARELSLAEAAQAALARRS